MTPLFSLQPHHQICTVQSVTQCAVLIRPTIRACGTGPNRPAHSFGPPGEIYQLQDIRGMPRATAIADLRTRTVQCTVCTVYTLYTVRKFKR